MTHPTSQGYKLTHCAEEYTDWEGKVKVALSLCLAKYHAMKYPVLN